MGASESTDRTPEWINGSHRSERTSNSSAEEENAGNGRGSTASKILTVAGAAIGAVALGGGLAYALSSSSASTSESPNHYSQPFSSSSSSSSGSFPSNHNEPKKQIRCNVDGSFRRAVGSSSKGIAGCGGVFRDTSGAWIHGFSRNLGSWEITKPELWGTYSTRTELLGIITGLSIAWKKGFRDVILESDNLPSVKMILKGCKENSDFKGLIQDVRSLLELPWEVDIFHIPEKENNAAHTMAGFSQNLEEGSLREFIIPPQWIERVLENDLARVVCSLSDTS